MTTTPDPKIVRDFARRAILSAAEEVDFIGIGEQFGDDENWPAEEAAYDAMHEAVNAEWKKATVAVSWPDEQPQDERDAQLADLATELDAANDDAYEIADRASKYREEIMRLRARIRELEGAQAERDGAKTAPPLVCNSRLHPDFADGEDVRCELPDSHAWHRSGERKWTP